MSMHKPTPKQPNRENYYNQHNNTHANNPLQRATLTRGQVADLFSITVRTVCNWDDRGILKPLKVGGRVLYLTKDIIELLRQYKSNSLRQGNKGSDKI